MAIHADSMHFIQIGQRIVFFGQRCNLGNRASVAIHRIDRFKDDQLWPVDRLCRQQLFEMRHAIMPEDGLFGARQLDTGNDRGVVHLVRQDQAIGKLRCQRRQAGLIRHITAGECEGAFGAMQGRKLGFQRDNGMACTRNIAGTTSAGRPGIGCITHCADHVRMLAHAQIII